MINTFIEEEEGEAAADPGKVTIVGVRMRPKLRAKLKRLAEAEGRMITEAAMLRILLRRADEPPRRRRRAGARDREASEDE